MSLPADGTAGHAGPTWSDEATRDAPGPGAIEAADLSWTRPPVPETVGLGPRFVAFTIDLLLASGIFVLVAAAVLGAVGLADALVAPVDMGALFYPLALVYLPVILVYFTLAEGVWGATVGKQVMGLRAVRVDGTPLSLFESFIRNALRFLWSFILVPDLRLVGAFFMMIDVYLVHRGELDQRIGDLGAETVVVRSRRLGD